MPKVSDEYFEQKRKEIVDAAYRVCMKKPITSVEMKDIIAETGFSHGVIYRYYSELDEVLQDLVIRINRSNRIDERLMEILDRYKIGEWKRTVKEVCGLLASYLEETEIDILKLSIYSDVLAMNDPKRVMRIASRLDKDDRSPLLILEAMMQRFLERVVFFILWLLLFRGFRQGMCCPIAIRRSTSLSDTNRQRCLTAWRIQ